MKRFFLISTDHLEDGLWFRDDEDFRVAMNYIAIQAASCPEVAVLAFILMSNHVHFVLRGRREDVLGFINLFKQRYSLYYRRKYKIREFLRGNGTDVKPVPNEDEALERALAYVQANCVAANICGHPSQYPWGTGNTFFNSCKSVGKRLCELSERMRERLLRSNYVELPEAWVISEEGFIKPENYVDRAYVESLFRSPKRMNYFLNNSSKAKKRMEMVDDNLPAFRDQAILVVLPDLLRSLFQKSSFEELNDQEQSEFARQIRFRFSADAAQIARLCGVSYAEAAHLLDGI
jgi:REP element-mobilizing transposase RayT